MASQSQPLSKSAVKNRKRREKKKGQQLTNPSARSPDVSGDDYEADFYKLPGGGFLTKEVVVFLRDVIQGRTAFKDFRDTLSSDDMRHIKNAHFQPRFSFAKLNGIVHAVVDKFKVGIPLPDALTKLTPYLKEKLQGTFKHEGSLWKATIDYQNTPLKRGGALLRVTFHMPNDGFLSYNPEMAPLDAAPLSMDLNGAEKLTTAQHGSRSNGGILGYYTLPQSLHGISELSAGVVPWLAQNKDQIGTIAAVKDSGPLQFRPSACRRQHRDQLWRQRIPI